jgi:hypothetical protein
MLALRKGAAGLAVLIMALVPLGLQSQEKSSSLYGQTASAMLNRSFPSPRVEYLLLDLRSQQTLAVRLGACGTTYPGGVAAQAICGAGLKRRARRLRFSGIEAAVSGASPPGQGRRLLACWGPRFDGLGTGTCRVL